MERQLNRRLEEIIGEEGEIHTRDWNIQIENGNLLVTLQAECTEEIGEEQQGQPLLKQENE